MAAEIPLLVFMRGITKRFLGVKANDAIDFDVRPGEVHTLLGENGAGKSTLMNVLCGLYKPDGGEIEIEGELRRFRTPRDAIAAGIGMVHQHFMLVPAQTVWENMVLGLDALPQVLPRKDIVRRIEEISERYALRVDPLAPVWQLSIGEQQRVAILKALYRQARILVLDEPTAVLIPQEIQSLFATIRQMRGEGHGIVFISHKLDEVLAVSDRISILRKGKKIGTFAAVGVTKEKLAEMMVGRQVFFNGAPPTTERGPVFLAVRDLVVRGERGNIAVQGVSLELRQKEIFGLAGVAGNGQLELCEAMVGLRRSESGDVLVQGREMGNASPRAFLDRGVAYIPEDRKGTGLVPSMNIRENVVLRKYWKKPFARGRWFIDWEVVAGHTGRLVERFGVITPGLGIPIRALSGGNLQKLMLARELSDNPKAIIAVQPTWGLDVGATEYVRERLLEQRDRGAAVFLVSEDLEELLALSDRLAVIHQGRIMGITKNPRALSEEDLGLLMAGTSLEDVLRGREERGDAPLPGPLRDPGTFFAGDGAAQKKAFRAEGGEGRTPWA